MYDIESQSNMQVNISIQSKVNIDSNFRRTSVFIIDYNKDHSC